MSEEKSDDHSDDDNASFKSFDGAEDDAYHSADETPSSVPDMSTQKREIPARLGKDPTSPPIDQQPRTPKTDFPSTPPPSQDRFPPEEESSLLSQSHALKATANSLFSTGSHENALQTYDRALALCPNYLDYEVAVLHANTAACNLKLLDWSAAVAAAGKGLSCLERLEPLPQPPPRTSTEQSAAGGAVEEVDAGLETRMAALASSGQTLASVRKLQTKLLLRRATANTSLATWSALQAASEDYAVLLTPAMQTALSPTDQRNVNVKVRELAPRLDEAKEREMAEMMGKLKGLGNSLLKPFGLSTSNFQFVKDEKSGGYSMNFDQGAK